MFEIEEALIFEHQTPETLFLDSGKITKNLNMFLGDINKISDPGVETFIKIYIGASGGHIRPILVSTKLLREFIESHLLISQTISNNASKKLTGEADE